MQAKAYDHGRMRPSDLAYLHQHTAPVLHAALAAAVEVSPVFDACIAFLEQGENIDGGEFLTWLGGPGQDFDNTHVVGRLPASLLWAHCLGVP